MEDSEDLWSTAVTGDVPLPKPAAARRHNFPPSEEHIADVPYRQNNRKQAQYNSQMEEAQYNYAPNECRPHRDNNCRPNNNYPANNHNNYPPNNNNYPPNNNNYRNGNNYFQQERQWVQEERAPKNNRCDNNHPQNPFHNDRNQNYNNPRQYNHNEQFDNQRSYNLKNNFDRRGNNLYDEPMQNDYYDDFEDNNRAGYHDEPKANNWYDEPQEDNNYETRQQSFRDQSRPPYRKNSRPGYDDETPTPFQENYNNRTPRNSQYVEYDSLYERRPGSDFVDKSLQQSVFMRKQPHNSENNAKSSYNNNERRSSYHSQYEGDGDYANEPLDSFKNKRSNHEVSSHKHTFKRRKSEKSAEIEKILTAAGDDAVKRAALISQASTMVRPKIIQAPAFIGHPIVVRPPNIIAPQLISNPFIPQIIQPSPLVVNQPQGLTYVASLPSSLQHLATNNCVVNSTPHVANVQTQQASLQTAKPETENSTDDDKDVKITNFVESVEKDAKVELEITNPNVNKSAENMPKSSASETLLYKPGPLLPDPQPSMLNPAASVFYPAPRAIQPHPFVRPLMAPIFPSSSFFPFPFQRAPLVVQQPTVASKSKEAILKDIFQKMDERKIIHSEGKVVKPVTWKQKKKKKKGKKSIRIHKVPQKFHSPWFNERCVELSKKKQKLWVDVIHAQKKGRATEEAQKRQEYAEVTREYTPLCRRLKEQYLKELEASGENVEELCKSVLSTVCSRLVTYRTMDPQRVYDMLKRKYKVHLTDEIIADCVPTAEEIANAKNITYEEDHEQIELSIEKIEISDDEEEEDEEEEGDEEKEEKAS